MTPELLRLREAANILGEFVDAIELELVDDPNWQEPSDASYLTAKELADPDIMSNVEAMAATNQLIAWFGKDREGFVGLWQGPERRPLPECHVVRLDTEGQYQLVATTVADYIAISVDDEDFEDARRALSEAGLAVRESHEAIWNALGDFDEPNDFRDRLYNQNRQSRGLEPIE